MFCGLCVEACPYDALFMGSGFEQGQYSRKDMVINIDQLRQAEKRPSTFFRPQLESAGYDPSGGQSLDWKEVGRESWRWHEGEKAGMRLSRPALATEEIQKESQTEALTDIPGTAPSLEAEGGSGDSGPASPEDAG
jgi:ferredoxin